VQEPCPIHQGHDRDERLASLGLTAAMITAAVEAGEAESRQCTDNDPPMAPGLTRYFRTVRVLREQTALRGWGRDNPRNLARTVSPSREHAIVPAMGDEHTGDPQAMPSTKYDKGTTIIEAISTNQQLALFDLDTDTEEDLEGRSVTTWVLLYHIADEEIRCELSLPVDSTDGYISQWRERILFPPLPREPRPAIGGPDDGPDEDGQQIDILVTRR
jgi:hypothetical protein